MEDIITHNTDTILYDKNGNIINIISYTPEEIETWQ